MGKRIYRNEPSKAKTKTKDEKPTMEQLMAKMDIQDKEPANVAEIVNIGGDE